MLYCVWNISCSLYTQSKLSIGVGMEWSSVLIMLLVDDSHCNHCPFCNAFTKDAYNKGKINDDDLNLAVGRLFAYRYQYSQVSACHYLRILHTWIQS